VVGLNTGKYGSSVTPMSPFWAPCLLPAPSIEVNRHSTRFRHSRRVSSFLACRREASSRQRWSALADEALNCRHVIPLARYLRDVAGRLLTVRDRHKIRANFGASLELSERHCLSYEGRVDLVLTRMRQLL